MKPPPEPPNGRKRTTMANTYIIAAAQPEHLAAIPEIEKSAAALFPDDVLPPRLREITIPREKLRTAQALGHVWVALAPDGNVVGFCLLETFEYCALLAEVDVLPRHERKGLGRRLVESALAKAQKEGFAAVYLTTFADIPWNAPLYARLGFTVVDKKTLPPPLPKILAAEARCGLRKRVAMRFTFASDALAEW